MLFMNIEKNYEYFLSRLEYEVHKLGHGGKAYIGKNIGKSGAAIGQFLSRKKKASLKTQVLIAEFITKDFERFIDEGKQLYNDGHIKGNLLNLKPVPTNKHNEIILMLEELENLSQERYKIIIEQIEFQLFKARSENSLPKKIGVGNN